MPQPVSNNKNWLSFFCLWLGNHSGGGTIGGWHGMITVTKQQVGGNDSGGCAYKKFL